MACILHTSIAVTLLALPLVACGAPITAPGPDWPRNGEGIPVDKTYGTPLPGRPPLY